MNIETHIALRAALEWHIESGVFDTLGEATVDRFETRKPPVPSPRPEEGAGLRSGADEQPSTHSDPVAAARQLAAACDDLGELRSALEAYPHCDLKHGARSLVFADGSADAPVMIIGEAPGREEDREGRPFVGRAGVLLDRMLSSIGLDRTRNVYITNVLPWRPPQNRDPRPDEIAMMVPFVERHVSLVAPRLVVLMGNISCVAGVGQRGITRLRGSWSEAYGRPALPMFHPAFLLRQPQMKREAWADLLALKARLATEVS